ncbi:MAG: ABC transporter [Brevundimonas subvibrioides]|uniref:ABC transporter n=1 Tax=Brevundimonas subvibrioides TaxID=74313 RepID=A0A258HDN9_9CAUL|nr:peptidase domain-containing ABC transporter [Brevundimonas subvibrioides]OYX54468.1 MAG: ABC transporter [Brevundimonas subvibrioides]
MVAGPPLRRRTPLMNIPSELNFARRRRLPVIQGAEAAECGLACMAMVARYHGHDVDLNGLRQRFTLSMSGATLRSIMGFADSLGFAPRALKVELSALSKVRLPAILHWDLNHFVVLKSVSGGKAVIHDPALGARTYSLDDLSNHFTGVALELTPSDTFEKVTARAPIKLSSLWSRMVGFWPAFFQILGLSLALQVAVFALPFQMQLVVDEAIFRADRDLLTVLAIGFGALVIVQSVIEALRAWALQIFGQMLSFQMVGNLVRHMIRLPSDWFEKRHVGDIISRIGSASAIQDVLTRGVIAAIIDGLMAVVAIIILLLYSPTLTAVVVGAVAINLILAFALFPAMKARTEEQIIESAREQSHIMETVRAATTIKVMGREAERESSWRNLYANAINADVSVGKFQISLGFTQGLITGLQTVIVIYLGARTILAGDGFSVGMLFAFLSFRQTFTDRANALINQAIQFRFLNLHLDRLADIVTAEIETSPAAAPPRLDVRGAMELRDIDFRYGAADRTVLEGLNLTVQPGEFLAITGASGGGKTTLLKLMLGLRHPTAGTITLDGQTATPDLWRAWREQVGVVAQDDRLLSGTIADNIAFFDPDLDMVRVQQAAYAAQVHEDIVRMPMQYLSLVGDMGSTLSGGQKQRVLLARALYRQPRILILDEGTANLDVKTEEVIADLIAQLPITRIVVAHRPALLQRADRVLVVESGTLSTAKVERPIAEREVAQA